jgi:hypothetical protein
MVTLSCDHTGFLDFFALVFGRHANTPVFIAPGQRP